MLFAKMFGPIHKATHTAFPHFRYMLLQRLPHCTELILICILGQELGAPTKHESAQYRSHTDTKSCNIKFPVVF